MNKDQKSELLDIDPHIKAWGESLKNARTQAGLDLIDLSRKLLVSKNQLLALETGTMKPFHNSFFYFQALQKYQTLLNIELIPGPKEVIIKSDHKFKERNLSSDHLKTSKFSYQISPKLQKKLIQYSLLGASLIIVIVIAVVLFRSPSEPVAPAAQSSSPIFSPTFTQPTPLAKTLELKQPPQSVQPTTQTLVGVASTPTTPPITTSTPSTKQVSQQPAMNILRITFSQTCWVQAIDKNGVSLVKTYSAGTTFEQPINNIKSLVIGNADAAKAVLNDKTIDLKAYIKPQSSTARLFEEDFASMQ